MDKRKIKTKEQRRKLSPHYKDPIYRKKQSENKKELWASGKFKGMKGKHQTKEAREKIAVFHKGKPLPFQMIYNHAYSLFLGNLARRQEKKLEKFKKELKAERVFELNNFYQRWTIAKHQYQKGLNERAMEEDRKKSVESV